MRGKATSSPPDLAGLPRDGAGAPVFAEPWQARAFALTTYLQGRGLFGWRDWTAALAAEIAADPASGEDAYWRAWVRALEALLAARGQASPAAVGAMAAAWQRAAAATPHGTPIRLENGGPGA